MTRKTRSSPSVRKTLTQKGYSPSLASLVAEMTHEDGSQRPKAGDMLERKCLKRWRGAAYSNAKGELFMTSMIINYCCGLSINSIYSTTFNLDRIRDLAGQEQGGVAATAPDRGQGRWVCIGLKKPKLFCQYKLVGTTVVRRYLTTYIHRYYIKAQVTSDKHFSGWFCLRWKRIAVP